MPVNIADRPLKKIREEVIDQLVMNYGHNEITLKAFEERLDIAMETEDRDALQKLVADLELSTDTEYQQTKAKKLSKDKNYFADNPSESYQEHESILKILSSSEKSGPWVVGGKIETTSILSDFTLDFTEAEFTQPVVRIKMLSILTSDTIYVPEGVRVVCNVTSILGSIKNQVFGNTDENAPTIIIEGFSILSSMDIKIRVTLKEKWLRFADGIKDLFK